MELADCDHRIASRCEWATLCEVCSLWQQPGKDKPKWEILFDYQPRMGKLVRGLLGVATLFSLPILLLHIRQPTNHKSPDNSSTRASSTTLLWEKKPLVDTPNISFASTPVREHTMGRELMDSIEADQLPVLFPNGVRNITKQVLSATAL